MSIAVAHCRRYTKPALTIAQVYRLAGLVPDRWRAFILLITFASLRRGEITALTRRDLDLESRTVAVPRQFVTVPGGLAEGPPKSRAGLRIVSFPARIVPDLERHLSAYSGAGEAGLVFPNEHGQPFRRGNFSKAVGWASARHQLGVPTLHLHDLRHTGNTLAARAGGSLRDLMTRMGHDSPAAAFIYQHSNRASDEAIAAALDAQLARYEQETESVPGACLGPETGPTPEGDAA